MKGMFCLEGKDTHISGEKSCRLRPHCLCPALCCGCGMVASILFPTRPTGAIVLTSHDTSARYRSYYVSRQDAGVSHRVPRRSSVCMQTHELIGVCMPTHTNKRGQLFCPPPAPSLWCCGVRGRARLYRREKMGLFG